MHAGRDPTSLYVMSCVNYYLGVGTSLCIVASVDSSLLGPGSGFWEGEPRIRTHTRSCGAKLVHGDVTIAAASCTSHHNTPTH